MASSSSSAGGSMLPTRRRNLQGPLHPLHRAPPKSPDQGASSAAFSSSPNRSSDDGTPPSVFLAPSFSRKRSYPAATAYSPTLSSSSLATPFLETDMESGSFGSYSSNPAAYHQQPTRMAQSKYAEPTMTNPLRAPQGEFSFQGPAPSAVVGTTAPAHTVGGSDFTNAETSSMAFAKLAQAQRAQQEAQRQAASGQKHSTHSDGPPVKKRRGVAGVLVEGALSAAIYTGAAAVTAYSLWSSWGRKDSEREESEGEGEGAKEELLPPGGLEGPPPPYIDQRVPGPSSKTAPSPHRPSHVYVSSRRRRPAFQSHRSARMGTPRRRGLVELEAGATMPLTPEAPKEAEDEEMDEDDLFARMQLQMSSLIEEGTRALQSHVELDDEEPPRSSGLTPSRSDPLGWSRTDRDSIAPLSFGNRSTSSRFELNKTPSQSRNEPFSFGASHHEPSTVFLSSPRANQATLGGSQNSPYSRIPRLGAPSTPRTPTAKRRFE